jgi:hypothetical protein
LPSRRPAAKIAIATPTTPSVISTQAHQGRPPESVVGGVVCVAWTLTVADLAIDAVPGGAAAVLVVVLVSAVLVSVWVTVRPGAVAVEPPVLETVALASTSLACWAALAAAVLAAPDPQPPSAPAMPSASAARTSGRRAVDRIITTHPADGATEVQWGAHACRHATAPQSASRPRATQLVISIG